MSTATADPLFLVTFHDATGARIDTDDVPLTVEQLDGVLANYDEISIPGQLDRFWRNGEGQIISFMGYAA